MLKALSLFTGLLFAAKIVLAGNSLATTNGALTLILFISIAALAIGIINAFRITRLKKIAEVDLINQKDDLNVSMEAVKVSLYKEIRNLKRELGRSNKPTQPSVNQKSNDEQAETNKNVGEAVPTAAEKKPFRKRPSNFKRRPPRKTEDNTDKS